MAGVGASTRGACRRGIGPRCRARRATRPAAHGAFEHAARPAKVIAGIAITSMRAGFAAARLGALIRGATARLALTVGAVAIGQSHTRNVHATVGRRGAHSVGAPLTCGARPSTHSAVIQIDLKVHAPPRAARFARSASSPVGGHPTIGGRPHVRGTVRRRPIGHRWRTAVRHTARSRRVGRARDKERRNDDNDREATRHRSAPGGFRNYTNSTPAYLYESREK